MIQWPAGAAFSTVSPGPPRAALATAVSVRAPAAVAATQRRRIRRDRRSRPAAPRVAARVVPRAGTADAAPSGC